MNQRSVPLIKNRLQARPTSETTTFSGIISMQQLMLSFALIGMCLTSFRGSCAEDWPGFGGPRGTFAVNSDVPAISAKVKPTLRWRRSLGDGLSGCVVSGELIYATYLVPFSESNTQLTESERGHREMVVALDRKTGQTRWEYGWDAGWLEAQEAFGGKVRSPQSTPLVHHGLLVTVGFTGLVHCFDRTSGDLQWQRKLVEDFAATPVQFGFSSSPIVLDDHLILLAGGKQGGLLCLNFDSGELLWNCPCEEASYATPVVLDVGNARHLVFVTRNEVVGVDPANGKELWRYAVRKPGMTNVPTPLATGDGTLVVSGQGFGGTRELQVALTDGEWCVNEGWESRAEFFYCNWICRDHRIVGCSGDMLLLLDARSGERLGRWRGFADSNLVALGERLLILDGEGVLSTMVDNRNHFEVQTRHRLMEHRCWTPPTISDGELYCRGGDELMCIQLRDAADGVPFEPLDVRASKLKIRVPDAEEEPSTADAIESIVSAFRKDGASTAFEVYLSIRQEKDRAFLLEERADLAELAFRQGLTEFGSKILQDAVADFPESVDAKRTSEELLKEFIKTPSKETARGDNGLLYVEVAIRNGSRTTMQTIVRGPPAHPFSYGIPFPAGKVRMEKWPVGTKLFRSDDELPQNHLYSVKESDAGKTIELPRPTHE